MSIMDESSEFDADIKRLEQDLVTVEEQIALCVSMMKESSNTNNINDNEALQDIIGFLEACYDRMGDLVEAGTSGMLSEELFAQTLSINDALCKTLEAEKGGNIPDLGDLLKSRNNSPMKNGNSGGDLLDLGGSGSGGGVPTPAPAPISSTSTSAAHEDVLNFGVESSPAPLPPPVPTTMDTNVFDSFTNLNTTTTNNNNNTVPLQAPPPAPIPAPAPAPTNSNNSNEPPAAPIDQFLSGLDLNLGTTNNNNTNTTSNNSNNGGTSSLAQNQSNQDIDAIFDGISGSSTTGTTGTTGSGGKAIA